MTHTVPAALTDFLHICGDGFRQVSVPTVDGFGLHTDGIDSVGFEPRDVSHCVGPRFHLLPDVHGWSCKHVVEDLVACHREVWLVPGHFDGGW